MSEIKGVVFFGGESEGNGDSNPLGTLITMLLLPAFVMAAVFFVFGSQVEMFLMEKPKLALQILTLIIPSIMAIVCLITGLRYLKSTPFYLVAAVLTGVLCFVQASAFAAGADLYDIVGGNPFWLSTIVHGVAEEENLVLAICFLASPFAIGCIMDALFLFQRDRFAPWLLVFGIGYYFYTCIFLFIILQLSGGDAIDKGGAFVVGIVFFSIPFALILGIRALLKKGLKLLMPKQCGVKSSKKSYKTKKIQNDYMGKYWKD